MANLGKMFDPNAHEPAKLGGSQLPVSPKEGWAMVVTDSEMQETAAKDGSGFLNCTLQIIEGEFKGVEGNTRFNLFNKNEQAVNIAEKQLTALAYCTGIFQPFQDSAILHNRPFRGVVGLQKVKAGEEDKGFTEVKGFLDINGNAPGKTGAAPAPAAPAAPPTPPPAAAVAQPAQAAWTPPAAAAPAPEAAPANVPWGGAAPAAATTRPAWAKPA